MGNASSAASSARSPGEKTPLQLHLEQAPEAAEEPETLLSKLAADVRERAVRDSVWRSHWRKAAARAEAISFMHRCVKINGDDELSKPANGPSPKARGKGQEAKFYSADQGKEVVAQTFSLRDDPFHLRHYGCSVAVELFLSFQVWSAALLVLMFVIAIAPFVDTVLRNLIRRDCRNGLVADYYNLTHGVGSLAAECGYEGRDVMQSPPESLRDLSVMLLGALGTCAEYSNAVQPVLAQPPLHAPGDVFVSTPDAKFCIGHQQTGSMALTSLCNVLNVLVVMIFIIWMRRKANFHVQAVDQAMLTAGDYAVQISGLQRDVDPDSDEDGQGSLRDRLLADLKVLMPERADAVNHVAFGVVCGEDLLLMKQSAQLQIDLHVFEEREQMRAERGEPPHTARTHRQKAELLHKHEEVTRELRSRAEGGRPKSTGHAFVCFELETDRNKLLKRYHDATHGGKPLPSLSSAAAAGTFCLSPAPEPAEINWANLELQPEYETRAVVVTTVSAVALVLALMGLTVLCKVYNVWAFEPHAGVQVQAGYYLVIGIGNPLLKALLTFFSTREGLDTMTEEERSLFTKLAITLHFNTLVIPLLLGLYASYRTTGALLPTQAWYEGGGLVDGFLVLCISNVAIDGFLQMAPMSKFVKRWILAPLTISPYKLNLLLMPPPMPLGYLHAVSFKIFSLCLMYSPLYPPAYLFSAAALLFLYFATKFAVAFHYRRPKQLDEHMLAQLRIAIGLAVLEHIVIMAMGMLSAATPSQRGAALVAPAVALALWAVLFFESYVPRPDWLLKWMNEHDTAAFDQNDTGGRRYSDIGKTVAYPVERYQSPCLQKIASDGLDAACLALTPEYTAISAKWSKVI